MVMDFVLSVSAAAANSNDDEHMSERSDVDSVILAPGRLAGHLQKRSAYLLRPYHSRISISASHCSQLAIALT